MPNRSPAISAPTSSRSKARATRLFRRTTVRILPAASRWRFAPPRVRHHIKAEPDIYAAKANAVVIRHSGDHKVITVLEIVSPGNKDRSSTVRRFAEKTEELLRGGVHLLVIDLFPPGRFDPDGIHKAIWDRFGSTEDFKLPPDKPLTLAAYIGGEYTEGFIELTSVGAALAEMPLFLGTKRYIPAPLEATYQAAWEAVPAIWRKVLAAENPPAK